MPTITIKRKTLDRLLGKKYPDEYLKDRISMLGTDLESLDENEINVEVFPNRPDMLSAQGFARALSTFIGIKIGLRDYEVKKGTDKVIVDKSVSKIRPFTACAIVKDLHLDDDSIREIIQVQEKLHVTFCRNRRKAAIGIYPFEKIRPPIRYLAMNPKEIKFRPLEFPREINGIQMLAMHPTGREYGHLLEGCEKFPVFMDSDNQILSVPPIINSDLTGKVTEKTKDVFIECSGFDFRILNQLLNILVTSLADMGGTIYSMELVYPGKRYVTPDLKPRLMALDADYANRILGLKLSQQELKKYLHMMGYDYSKNKVMVPAYRADILHQIDIVEDIAIAYGYENFSAELPKVATIGSEDPSEVFKKRIARILTGLGLLEVNTYHLTNKNNNEMKMNCKMDSVELENAMTEDFSILRSWMLPVLLQVFVDNKHHEYPQKIFDIGTIFKKNDKFETNVEEDDRLCVAFSHSKADFTEIKQAFDYLMRMLDIKYKMVEVEHPSFISGRAARVIVNDKKVAYIGEIHPQVLLNFGLEMPVAVFELNLSELF